jgi:hypothetical protein
MELKGGGSVLIGVQPCGVRVYGEGVFREGSEPGGV